MAARDFINELKDRFRRGDIVVRLIYINVGVFLLTTLISVAFMLFNNSAAFLDVLSLPASVERFLLQPWSILTYMFMHAGVLHILFNMLWLFWFGRLFLIPFSAIHLRGLYIFGGLCGGLLYMLAFNIFPFFETQLDSSVMVGASASVLAIVAATAYREPNYQIRFFMLGSVRLKYVALVVVLLDLLLMTSSNGGGHIAHIGGALAGLAFAAGLDKGIDLTSWINKVINIFSRIGSKSNKPKMKVNYGGNKHSQDYEFNARRKANADHIDHILDKIKKSGYESLTNDEKKSLFDASKK